MDLSDVADLTDIQKKAIMKQYGLHTSALQQDYDKLLARVERNANAKKMQDEQIKSDRDKSEADKMQDASSLEDVKKLLFQERESRTKLEQRIIDGEKERVQIENKGIIDSFVNDFISENVVNDSIVRDAIKVKISNRLGVRDKNVVELNGSELTGRSGEQVLSDVKADRGYSTHLIANRAKGGGAPGGVGNSGGIVKTMSRDEFEQMSHSERPKFYKSGGVISDQ